MTTCLSIALPIEKLLPSITSRLPLPLIRFNEWRNGMLEMRNYTERKMKNHTERKIRNYTERKMRHEDSRPLFDTIQLAGSQCYTTAVTSTEKIYKHLSFLPLHLDNQWLMCMVYLTLPCRPSNPILVSSVKFFSPNTLPPPSPRSHVKKWN